MKTNLYFVIKNLIDKIVMLELIQLVTLHYYHLSNLCAIPRCQITNFVFIHLNTHTHIYDHTQYCLGSGSQ